MSEIRPLPPKVVLTGEDIARAIFDSVPRNVGCVGQWSVDALGLVLLLEHRDGRSIGEIRGALDINQASASELVERVARFGLVEVKVDGENRRVHRVWLLPKARQQRRRARGNRSAEEQAAG